MCKHDFDLREDIKKAAGRSEQLNSIHEKNIEKKLNTLIDQNEKIIKLLKKVVKQNA